MKLGVCMYYFEIEFQEINNRSISPILEIFHFNPENITNSNFYKLGRDVMYEEISSFEDYFANTTNDDISGGIGIESLFMGIEIKKLSITIHFKNNSGILTILWGVRDELDFQKNDEKK